MVLPNSFDDDEAMVLPSLSTKTPLLASLARAKTRERRQAWEATAIVPKSAWMT